MTEQSVSFSLNGTCGTFHGIGTDTPIRLLLTGDQHFDLSDSRDDAYADHYARMASHSKKEAHRFHDFLSEIQTKNYDALLLAGDLISFPTEANLDFVSRELEASKIPFLYTAGNHDWHFEGLAGTEISLRAKWLPKLSRLFCGKNPLMSSDIVRGLQILRIDNSIYEVLPEQLEFFREKISSGMPTVLLCHVPLYVPGRDVFFGCGHPDWNAANDPYSKIERRPPWRKNGHTETTFSFHKEVFESPNLIGIFAGHTHSFSMDVHQGKIQIVAGGHWDATELIFR